MAAARVRFLQEHGVIRTDEQNNKVAESMRQRWQDAEYVARHRERMNTPETKARLSAAMKAVWARRKGGA